MGVRHAQAPAALQPLPPPRRAGDDYVLTSHGMSRMGTAGGSLAGQGGLWERGTSICPLQIAANIHREESEVGKHHRVAVGPQTDGGPAKVADHHDCKSDAALVAEKIEGRECQCHRQPVKAKIVSNGVRSLAKCPAGRGGWGVEDQPPQPKPSAGAANLSFSRGCVQRDSLSLSFWRLTRWLGCRRRLPPPPGLLISSSAPHTTPVQ